MKEFLSLGVLAAGLAMMSSSAQAAVNLAVVRAVQGTASYSLDEGQTWRPVEEGFRLKPPAIVRTGVGSRVDLFLGVNGPVVRITPNTQLGLDKLDAETGGAQPVIDTELNLTVGEILGNVRPMAEGSKYSVKTPLGVAGVRATDTDTEYDISADGTVHVITGTMVVAYINTLNPAQPSIVTVNAGETSHAPVTPGQVVTASPTPPDVLALLTPARTELEQETQRFIVTPNPVAPPHSPFQGPQFGERPTVIPTAAITIQPIVYVSPVNGLAIPHAPGAPGAP